MLFFPDKNDSYGLPDAPIVAARSASLHQPDEKNARLGILTRISP
jgi:hypothetical protein